MACLRVQRAMQRNDIALPIDLFKRHISQAEIDGLKVLLWIMSNRPASESAQYLRHSHADAAVPMMPTFWRAAQNRATPARKNYRCEPGYKPGEDAGLAPA